MIKINEELPLKDLYLALIGDERVIQEAAKIADREGGSRTLKQKIIAAHRGVTLQYAVAMHLFMSGYSVKRAPEDKKYYDLEVSDGDKTYYVDVKGRFDGKYFQQTEWEALVVPTVPEKILYFCVDVIDNNEMRFLYKGCAFGDELLPSQYGCPYAASHVMKEIL